MATTRTTSSDIDAFIETWNTALRKKDVDAYAACYTDDIRVFDAMMPPQHKGIADWRTVVENWFGMVGEDSDIEMKDLEIEQSGDLAVIHALMGFSAKDEKGEKRAFWVRQTEVLRRVDGDWKICHEHNSVPANEEGQAVMDMQP